MDIKQLEVFLSVAHHLSFSKAAEEMYVSQPTVSAYISSLEKQLNTQLLIRNTKEVSLTKAGQELLNYAQKILSLRDQALQSIGGASQKANGSLDIIASTIPGQHLLPEIIASFHKTWPNIIIKVSQTDSRHVEQEMIGFRYDFGMSGTIPSDDRLIHYPVFQDELVLVVPNSLTDSAESIRQNFSSFVLKHPFIMRESGSGTRAEIESLLTKSGVSLRSLRTPAFFSDAHGVLGAVAYGMGISLISQIAASMYVEAGLLRSIEMQSPLFNRQIHLLHNKELWLSPLQQAFADHVQNFYLKN